MTRDDLPYVAKLETSNTYSSWSLSMLQDEIRLGSYCCILENGLGVRMGYIVARLQLDEWHLMTFNVDPAFRRRGWARHLLKGLINQAQRDDSRAVLLEVGVSNMPARTLYQDMGFRFLYIRRAYYKFESGTEDAIVLNYCF